LTNKVASSPERHTFQKEGAIRRAEEEGEEPNQAYIDMWEQIKIDDANKIHDPAWQKNNLEYDLRSSKEMCDKVKASDNYAQNLYAAMCNMEWRKRELWNELKEENWGCSWRHAGGIIADMREEGDYINWYCSGIGNEELGNGLDGTIPDTADGRDYVPEGVVTEEIESDLNRLGWRPIPWTDNDN